MHVMSMLEHPASFSMWSSRSLVNNILLLLEGDDSETSLL